MTARSRSLTSRPEGRGRLQTWRGALGLLAAGALLGAARWDPSCAPLAFAGIALAASSLARETARHALTAVGLVWLCLAALWVGQPWHADAILLYVPGGPGVMALAAIAFSVPWVTLKAAPLLVGAWLARRHGWPVWAWLPVAWCLGEAAWEHLSGLGHDGWLYAQWQNEAVLRMLGRLGWWPTVLSALVASAALGEAITRRTLAPAGLAGAIALAFLAMPALPVGAPDAFADVGAVYMDGPGRMPTEIPPGVRLLVWPESASGQLPVLAEGQGGHLIPPIPSRDTAHLIGLQTRTPDGNQNALVGLAADGRVSGARAKRSLFPLLERNWLGLHVPGAVRFVPGAASPVFRVGERRVAALLCVEALDRRLVAQARREQPDLLVIAARDRVLARSPLAERQLLAVAVMQAVETGLPTVRAAMEGPAALIRPDGRVLASATGTGVLTLARDWKAPERAPDTVVLYSRRTPWLRAALPEAACVFLPIEDFRSPGWQPRTVVVAGHAEPPTYLGGGPEAIARAVAALNPELVVLDTCFGASSPLLEALAATGTRAHVVAPPIRIPESGLIYEPGFLHVADPAERARRVHTEPRASLFSGSLDPRALVAARAQVAGLPRADLRARLVSLYPPLVRVAMPHTGAPVVVPVDASRLSSLNRQ